VVVGQAVHSIRIAIIASMQLITLVPTSFFHYAKDLTEIIHIFFKGTRFILFTLLRLQILLRCSYI
jgi:hypothetical protein